MRNNSRDRDLFFCLWLFFRLQLQVQQKVRYNKERQKGGKLMSFVHLQTISVYSLLQSTTQLEELVQNAKQKGYQAIALTDYNYLHGQVDFYKLCLKEGIKPIIGLQLDLPGIFYKDKKFPLVMIAKNYKGYQKLMALSTLYTSDKTNEELLSGLKGGLEDLIAITPGEKGEIENLLLSGEYEAAEKIVQYWKEIFSEGQFYLGVQVHENMQPIIDPLKELGITGDVPLTAMHDVRYLEPGDHFSCRVLQAIGNSEQIDTSLEEKRGEYYLPPLKEIQEQFQKFGLFSEAEETRKISERIAIELPLHQSLLPKYPIPPGTDSQTYLKKLCQEGLQQKVNQPDSRYHERLNYELSVIHEMGFDDYFLIVWDVMHFAKQAGILPGAGRGSAAGSLVAYVLQITHVDPIEYHLLFERFLNKERYNMPDIDLDFPDNRRDEVLRYVKKKYGADHVAQIVTFGTLATKMSLRDTARVFGYSTAEAAKWSSAVPNQLGIRLTEAYENSLAFRKLADSSPENKLLFETAKKIEGVPRHTSTHAAGVVISDRLLIELVPLQERKNDLSITQYPMGNVEEIGLLKMDFLGLKNLTILNNAVQLAEKENQQKLDVFSFPMNDPKTMELFRRADTNGIFQFESPGIKNVLQKLGPESMEDIVAVNALYRPGPMEQINTFIDRKKGKQKIEYLHPDLEDILSVTYGVMVYQEQVMQVASRMAGFTLGEADILRRAIGKKQKEAIDEERSHFIDGAVQKGYSLEKAKEVYDYIERFANYGFNRSHSVAYSYIAYQMAYMKTHYPAAFFAALLNSVNPHSDKMKEYGMDIRKRNLSFEYPDINTSSWNFSLTNQKIQFGLTAIKGLRRDFIQHVLSERKKNGFYKDFVQFLRRIPEKWVKSEIITPLILSGAFDKFDYNRATLLQSLPGIISSIQYSGNNIDLFDVLEPKYIFRDELSSIDLMESEEEYLGYSLIGHPVDAYSFLYKEDEVKYIGELSTGHNLTTMGLLKEIKRIQTKKGEPMAFLTLTDSTGVLNVTIFPEQYLKFMKLLKEGTLLTVFGKIENSKQYERPTFILQKMTTIDQYIKTKEEKKKTCYIRITGENNPNDQFDKMQKILLDSPGEHPVIVYDEIHSKKILMDKKYWIDSSDVAIKKLINLFGNKNIVFK